MPLTAKELKEWINSLPSDTSIGIDEGGLTLQVEGNPDVYLEIGGLPEDATIYCPACEKDVKDEPHNRTSLADHGRCFDCQKLWISNGHYNFPRSDWQYEVQNGDTNLGYDEWLDHKLEGEFPA